MRSILTFLLLFTLISCNPKVDKARLAGSLQVQTISFPSLDPFSTRISHVKEDTLIFLD